MIGLFGFAALWGAGRWLRWRPWAVWALAALWWLAIMAVHLPMVASDTLIDAVGGTFDGWLVFGLLGALVALYRLGFSALKARARPLAASAPAAAVPAPGASFGPAELDRYARHILLREIGGPGQKRLKAAKVLVVGAGGLGSPALLYLAAAGVGRIGVIDPDTVEGSNLQRQIIHADERIGMPKVFSAEAAMKALNPFVEVRPYHRRFQDDIAEALVAEYDLVLDGTDNFGTRYLVNRTCAKLAKPLVAGAITQWEGQLSVWDPARGAPCYECVFPVRPAPGMVPTCAEAGVAAPLPGIIGTMMAMEAVKLITGAGEPLRGRLMIHDALYAETRVIGVQKRPGCPVCGES
ncbi:molybdopterin-synthase adenylyltransferase MoeB [Rhodobacter sp. Har01]|uniref:HesA/MoeB/ThiF family protein n=1 Tax=Rhodobacter sp. Har01 TaxID=2883999 RepID=UPI001D060A3C|nr:molybdopterin-synthase adenylyltransferase MoeB [Rhodobacter sp. Har01]MCB6178999.1 molybdopterin-synthase adenylyltransferase MoeB [Rhodobacter sp. Har01]